ncbi:hypothetical protein IFM89_000742 [Coptis chinensis]|uniref:Cytochrome P450 n=1 Tax=Coptis chinensis TaxID=261450 RepID=A0A835IUA0_9MAGN|nr:hypothetical protein IFM89_000742 [Coptis chinensis]
MSPLVLLASTIFFTIFSVHKLFYQRSRFKFPSGPRPWPLVGNLYGIKPVRFRCFAKWAQTYGLTMSVWFGSNLNVVVSNSELAEEVLKHNDQKLADRQRSRSAAKFSRNGKDLIWADYGPHFVKVKRVCTLELFSRSCGKSVVLKNYVSKVTFNNITRLAFGKRFVDSKGVMDEQGVEFKAIVANGLKLGASLAMAEHIPWLRWIFPLEEAAFAKHGKHRTGLQKTLWKNIHLPMGKGQVWNNGRSRLLLLACLCAAAVTACCCFLPTCCCLFCWFTFSLVLKQGLELDDFISGPCELLLKFVEENYPLPPKPDSLPGGFQAFSWGNEYAKL